MIGRHKHVRTCCRWGKYWPTWPDPTRCANCGSQDPVARWGAIPVCAACYDLWMQHSYRRPMTECERYDRRMDAIADMAADAQREG